MSEEQKETQRMRHMQHSHDFCMSLGSAGMDGHSHRCKGMLHDMMPMSCGGHRHRYSMNTDFSGHNHRITGECGPAINLGGGKHIHLISGSTACDCGHSHRFEFCTSIDCAGSMR